ncbi:MAG: prepilin-type N-terminal cleavage/methylation domain-containing protein [bacterium]
MLKSRARGFTLVELLVALVLAAVVLGTATTSALRQQRSHSAIISMVGADAQIRAATQVLASQLSLLDPHAGDLVAGEAQDTVLQIRAPIAHGITCRRETGAVTFVPDTTGAVALGGSVSQPHPGDTLWWLADTSWVGRQVTSTRTTSATCAIPFAVTGQTLQLVLTGVDTIDPGTPLRVTRQTRLGIYRSSGTWQLGFREWDDPTHRFSAPQPVAGPLLLQSGTRRTGFRYFDSGGAELLPSGGPIDVSTVARIRITAHSIIPVQNPLADSIRTDSLDVALHYAIGH